MVTGETGGDDALLHAFGDEAVGMMSACPYTLDLDTDGNKKFIAAMQKDFNVVPGFYAAGLYVNCDVVDAGLKAAGGKTDDKDKLMAALKAVNLKDTPRGPIKFDHLGNVVGNFYVRQCEKGRTLPTASSSGTRRSRPTRTSASSGPGRRRSSSRIRSIRATIRR